MPEVFYSSRDFRTDSVGFRAARRSSPCARGRGRRVFGMGKFSEKLKSVLMHDDLSDIPAKQIHRWEDEGGAIAPSPKRPRRYIRRRRPGKKPVDGGTAV